MKLYHGTKYKGKLDCEELRASNDGMIHFHTKPAIETQYGDNVVVCDTDLELDDMVQVPDLDGWDAKSVAKYFYGLKIITIEELQQIIDMVNQARDYDNYDYIKQEQIQQYVANLLKDRGIPAFKYINQFEDEYKGEYSVAVLDSKVISNPQYYYPGQGRDEVLKTATTLTIQPPEPPFAYSGYKHDRELEKAIQHYQEWKEHNPSRKSDVPSIKELGVELQHIRGDEVRKVIRDREQQRPKVSSPTRYQQRRGRGSFRK